MDEWLISIQAYNSAEDPRFSQATIETLVSFEPVPSQSELDEYPAGDIGALSDTPADLPVESPKPLTGGPDFNNAVAITPGSYSDAIVPGEFKYYRFPVEWGQIPQVTIETDPSVRETLDDIRAQLYSPLRVNIGDSAKLNVFDEPETASTRTSRVVNFRNREANTSGWDYTQAGDFYLGVSMAVGQDDDKKGLEQPIRFTLAMDGEEAPGPDWRPLHEPGPEPSDTPLYPASAQAETTPTSAAPTESSFANPNECNSQADDTANAQASSESSGFPWALGAGAIGIIALLGVLFAVLKRKNSAH